MDEGKGLEETLGIATATASLKSVLDDKISLAIKNCSGV